jgi:DNA-binding GntR family transcriptional regulator
MTRITASRSDILVERLRARIISGAIEPESWIKQDVLAAELGISKIPLREMLRKLEEEGLVTSSVNRGFFVRPLLADEAEDIFGLRLKLEPDAVAEAAVHATDADRAHATDALDKLQEATSSRSDEIPHFNRAFHMALVRPVGKSVTITLIERLHILAERYVCKHLEPKDRPQRANAEHFELLNVWLSRDRHKIVQTTHDHILVTLMDLRLQLGVV